ncbi:MAG: hypothetical protein ABS46_03940 [Cytophagaceae bacterium SCN 52-12]|nr:MAG: hypothetical protein ABS46_03940 [Cytophagaceae bacterium SCN 52-12]
MKKIFIPFILFTLASLRGFACDVCGCANSGSYFGLMPQSHKSIIGVRYNYLYFDTHPDSKLLATKETFNVAELYGRFFPFKRVQVMAFVPYRFDEQVTSAITKKNSGPGDITALASYSIFNGLMDGESSSDFTHSFLAGGGVKLPTGKFRYNENDPLQVANANFQLGTGSVDFILNAFYTLNWKKWGLSTNISRKFNTKNAEGYRFGNQLYGSADLFHTISLGRLSLMPGIGIYGEYSAHGRQNDVILDITGGTIINGSAGLTLFAEKWMLGITAQKPVHQKSASGHVFLRDRLQVQLGFLF